MAVPQDKARRQDRVLGRQKEENPAQPSIRVGGTRPPAVRGEPAGPWRDAGMPSGGWYLNHPRVPVPPVSHEERQRRY
jgi:hypothetical protein